MCFTLHGWVSTTRRYSSKLNIIVIFVKILISKNLLGISADAVRILLHAGLMKRDEADGSPVITQAGFQFLLLETASQVEHLHFILHDLEINEIDCI